MKKMWPVRSLSELLGKDVRLELKDGRVIEGQATSFDDFTVDENAREMIGIQASGYIDCAYDEEILVAYDLTA